MYVFRELASPQLPQLREVQLDGQAVVESAWQMLGKLEALEALRYHGSALSCVTSGAAGRGFV